MSTTNVVTPKIKNVETPLYNLEYWLGGVKKTTVRRRIPLVDANAIIIDIKRKEKYYQDGLLVPRRITKMTRQHTYANKMLALFDKAFAPIVSKAVTK